MAPPTGLCSSPDHLPHTSPGAIILLCRRTDGKPVKQLSPWAIDDTLRPLDTSPLIAELTPDGTALKIFANDKAHAHALQTITHIADTPVSITTTNQSTQGTIWAPELDELSTDVLLEGFGPQGVTAVYRPPRGPKALHVLTFAGSTLPPKVHAGYLMYEVRALVPKPRRCAKCQRYGHVEAKCRSHAVCGQCALPHPTADCQSDYHHCAACGGDHPVTSKDCPKWQLEVRVSTLISKDKLPPREARSKAEREFGFQAPTPRRRLTRSPPKPAATAAADLEPLPPTPPTVRRRRDSPRRSPPTSDDEQAPRTPPAQSKATAKAGAGINTALSKEAERRPRDGEDGWRSVTRGRGRRHISPTPSVESNNSHTSHTDHTSDRSPHSSPDRRQRSSRKTRGAKSINTNT